MTVLATGGFGGSPELVAEHIRPSVPLRLRANPWSAGDGLRHGLERGAATSAGLAEFYGRNMPDTAWGEDEFVSASQLYAGHVRIFDEHGVEFFRAEEVSWSETNVVQATARRPGARAYYLLTEAALAEPAVAVRIAGAVAPDALPFEAPPGTAAAVRVVAAITHTIGGLRVDERARVPSGRRHADRRSLRGRRRRRRDRGRRVRERARAGTRARPRRGRTIASDT